ncbi:MAG TPA: DUF4430 domain-containing protein [Solirubrobacteraceae bacterium]|nr:DUF4430 domain-containing protein [Solirubrobacteraceae bacterium]
MSRTRNALSVVAAATAVAIAGCGLGPGPGTSDVNLTVTRNFGTAPLGSFTEQRVPGSETVMRMLERHFQVATRYGGGFVESIDGRSGTSSERDWFFYVNGVEAAKGAAVTAVHKGDRIWWDLHDWSATDSIPAVVGSFPEPFVNGTGGRRLPTVLECASEVSHACERVAKELDAVHVPVAMQAIGTGGSGTDSLTIVVGTAQDLRVEIVSDLLDQGPRASGVYARFAGRGGSALELLDPEGDVVRTLGTGSGLIAATSQNGAPPTWVVTGTTAGGVNAAAAAFSPAALHDHFALAVQGASDIPVPVGGSM